MRSVRLNRITVAAAVALAILATQLGHAASTASSGNSTLIQSQDTNLGTWSIGQIEIPLSATGGAGDGTYTWSVIDGSLPPGISLRTDLVAPFPPSAGAGLIGVATTPGDYGFTLRVTSGGETADQASTLRVSSLGVKDSAQLPDAFVGTFYSYTLTAVGNAGPVTWANTDPSSFPVPPGLTLSAAGELSGIPTTAGNYQTSLGVTDGTDTVFRGLGLRVSAIEITTPGVLPNATQNAAYAAAVAASGGSMPYTFSASSLPNGLSMNTAGGISGTVNTSAGKYSVNVTATDAMAVSVTKTMSINVVGVPVLLPSISPYGNALADCTIGLPCSRGINVFSGGTAPFAWSADGLPAGMSIRTGDGVTSSWITPGDAELWGRPNATGPFSVELTVTDATGATATNTFPLKVSPLLQTNYLPNGTLGTAYSQALRVIGGSSPYTAAQIGGGLAAGVTLDGAALTVSGTPTESGSFSPVFRYTDSVSQTLTYTNYLNVNGAGSGGININTSSDLGSATSGASYSRTLNACCAPGSISWSQIGGALPAGVSLTPAGALTGTPTSSGQYTFLIKAEDGANAANYAVRQFTLNVTPISINGSSTLTTGNVGTAFLHTLTASGGTGALTWTPAPFSYLPPGLTLAANGTLSGTPTAPGQFSFSVAVADTASNTATRQFSLSIYPAGTAPPVFQSQSPNFGTFSIGQLETSLSATGGNGTYTWSIVAGSLPPGLAVRADKPSYFPSSASAGLIGVATTPGLYSFTLRVSSGGASADQVSTLKVTPLVSKESQLPDAFVGVPYSYALGAVGSAGAATWTPSGSVPAGLSLSSAGVLSGTPTTPGFSNISFSLADSAGTVFKGVSLNIYAVRITSPGVLPNATQNAFYSTTILAAGGAGGFTFSANGLPNGLSINSASGVISGTVNSCCSSPGIFSVNVTARDSANTSYTKTMSIDVVGAAATLPSLVPSNSNIYDCTVGVSCTRTISVRSGTAPFTWTATGLPPGMSMRFGSGTTTSSVTPGDAQLWGTPTALGGYNVQLTVTDALGATATNTFPMTVSALLQTTFLTSGTMDTAYSQTLRVLGGTGPYTVLQTAGQLAAGLTVNSATLLLSGVPAESGNFNPVFTYTDAASHVLTIDSSFFINGAGSNVSISTNSNLGSRTTGSFYSNSFSACCGGTITWSSIGGSLPPGLTLSSGGLLSGTPSTSGAYTFMLKATGSPSTNYAARQFTLNVTPLSISSSTLPFGNVGTAYSQTLTATGGTGAVTWTLPAGNHLPPGLTLASNGLFSGTPTESGQYQFTVNATDTASQFRSNTFTVSIYPVGVNPPVAISNSGSFGTFSIGQVETPLTATGGNGTYTWSLVAGSLPPGLSIRTDRPSCCFPGAASAGLIGIATTPGNYSFTLRVTSGGETADRASTLKITALTAKENQLPDAFVGAAYWYALSALGNAGAVTWTPSGSLPAGLSLSAAGVVSGTPGTAGFSNINFTLADSAGTVSKSVSLNIYAVRITTPGALPDGTQNGAYSATITAAGGTGVYTFTAGCCLPDGLSLSPDGVISGTVNTGPGKYQVYITARDSNNASYSKTMSIAIVGVPVLPSVDLSAYGTMVFDDCTIGVSCSNHAIAVTNGTAPYTWTATGLPPGMSIRTGSGTSSWLTPGDAELWGTATATGDYNVQVTVTDANLSSATASLALHVSPLLATNVYGLANGTLDVLYSQALRVIGGDPGYTGALTAGRLPAGLTLNGGTLAVSGTPAENGSFNPVFLFTDSYAGVGKTLRVTSNLFISGGTSTISINHNGDLGSVAAWTPLVNQLSACCAAGYVWSVTSGTLPPGVTLSAGGLLTGTPTTAGPYTFLVKSADSTNAANFGARQFTLTVTAATITLSAATAVAGQSVTATVANGPANAWDWVGLYPTGATSATVNRLSYQYLNGLQTAPASGVSGATLSFVLPSAGSYEVRFFRNNSLTVLATSSSITVAGPSIALSATTAVPGQSVTATVANGPANAWDWVGLYPTGATSATVNRLSYQYLNGLQTAPASGVSGATLSFVLPSAGSYEVRFFRNNSLTVLATSSSITVAGPSIALSATTAAAGQSVTATIANGPANAWDWVGLYPTGATSATVNRLSYQYLNGLQTAPASGVSGATLSFALPSAGSYEVRFFRDNSLTVLATSASITVAGPSVALSATTVAAGQSVTATIANGPANAWDWVGLYPTGATSATVNRLSYQYLNGLQTAPASGVSGATLSFALPSAGTYELRFFRDNSLTVLATSGSITVAAPSIALSATTATAGQSVTATIANGPANAWDWVGLYPTGATSATVNRLSYQFLNGLQTAPASGVSGATLSFALPSAGTYELRFFRNNSLTVLATSGSIVVQVP